MATLVTLPDRQALVQHVQKIYASWLPAYDFSHGLTVKPYFMEPDKRCGWAQTYIVLLEGLGPIGFTDSPLDAEQTEQT